jgi:hypothetical protein
MADIPGLVVGEVMDQVTKVLKDKALKKLLKLSKSENLTDQHVQAKLREMGFKDIADDPAKYKQFHRLSKLPLSEFKWRFARILIGVGSSLGNVKRKELLSGSPLPVRAASNIAHVIARGTAKDYAEKTIKNRGFKNILDKPELMRNIAKSLKEKNK